MDLIIDLIRLGFHGFAAAMLLMGFKLLNQVISQQDDDHSDGSQIELRMLLRSVRFFLWISVLFFLLGVTSELARLKILKTQKNEMAITLQPGAGTVDTKLLPTLYNEQNGKIVNLDVNSSTYNDEVIHGQNYTLQIDLLNQEIADLRAQNKKLLEDLNEVQNVTEEGGISDEF